MTGPTEAAKLQRRLDVALLLARASGLEAAGDDAGAAAIEAAARALEAQAPLVGVGGELIWPPVVAAVGGR